MMLILRERERERERERAREREREGERESEEGREGGGERKSVIKVLIETSQLSNVCMRMESSELHAAVLYIPDLQYYHLLILRDSVRRKMTFRPRLRSEHTIFRIGLISASDRRITGLCASD